MYQQTSKHFINWFIKIIIIVIFLNFLNNGLFFDEIKISLNMEASATKEDSIFLVHCNKIKQQLLYFIFFSFIGITYKYNQNLF